MTTKIFISHGHDELAKAKLKDFVRDRLHMEVLVLAEQPDLGHTIVEKLEYYGPTCQFALILLTGDDETALGRWRARQNVIHELGYFHGVLGRKRVLLLKAADIELFSNISGLIYKEFPPGSIESVFEDIRLAIESDDASQHARSVPIQPSQETRDSISNKLQATWDRYIHSLHLFIAISLGLIIGLAGLAGLAGLVALLPRLRGEGATPTLGSKNLLFFGFVLLMLSFVFQVSLRIWAQMFMEYEILQPQADVHKYFGSLAHYTWSYRVSPLSYTLQSYLVRFVTFLAAISFLGGLSLSLLFLFKNLQ